jgi:hypothetical protein
VSRSVILPQSGAITTASKIVTRQRSRWQKPSRWIIALAFLAFVGFVVERSFQVAGYQCTVCVTFAARSVCRTVEAATANEARASAMNNACAFLASGVTDSMACERTPPSRDECVAIN